MLFDGHVGSTSDCATRPTGEEIGSTGLTAPTRTESLRIALLSQTEAQRREPVEGFVTTSGGNKKRNTRGFVKIPDATNATTIR